MDDSQIIGIVIVVLGVTMYIRVELDFKKNVFRLLGHLIASILLGLLAGYEIGILSLTDTLWWLLFSSVYLLINETIRIYLRKHRMSDILQNHPRLYWLTRGKLKGKN
ncbi:MAG: hypothetical protein ACYC7D_09170 [Nitrososphaerales archaeon]